MIDYMVSIFLIEVNLKNYFIPNLNILGWQIQLSWYNIRSKIATVWVENLE